MEDELLIIFLGSIFILIVIGLSVNGIVSKMLDYKRSLRDDAPRGEKVANAQLAERTAMIEDRLAVLERIATDRGQLLSDEIEQLRIDAKAEEQHP